MSKQLVAIDNNDFITVPVLVGGTEVVSRAVYDLLLREVNQARQTLERYGLGDVGSLTEGIEALGSYAAKYGWQCDYELELYRDWLETTDDAVGRQ